MFENDQATFDGILLSGSSASEQIKDEHHLRKPPFRSPPNTQPTLTLRIAAPKF